MLDTSDIEEANNSTCGNLAAAAVGAVESESISDLALTLRKLPPLDPSLVSKVIGEVRINQKRTRRVSFSNNNVTIDIPARSSLSSEPTDPSVYSNSLASKSSGSLASKSSGSLGDISSSLPSLSGGSIEIEVSAESKQDVEKKSGINYKQSTRSTPRHLFELIRKKIKSVLHG